MSKAREAKAAAAAAMAEAEAAVAEKAGSPQHALAALTHAPHALHRACPPLPSTQPLCVDRLCIPGRLAGRYAGLDSGWV